METIDAYVINRLAHHPAPDSADLYMACASQALDNRSFLIAQIPDPRPQTTDHRPQTTDQIRPHNPSWFAAWAINSVSIQLLRKVFIVLANHIIPADDLARVQGKNIDSHRPEGT
ncbi:MAG: hypothetical protein ACYC2J_08650 [Acidithiobacillus ferrooxidans]|uniref:Uncharacterized protein n=1 Tax=mine drainage metagenome TaxID=410659 RepID=E6Q926_9ZZZZ